MNNKTLLHMYITLFEIFLIFDNCFNKLQENVAMFIQGWLISTALGVQVQVAQLRQFEKIQDSRLFGEMSFERVQLTDQKVLIQSSRIKSVICLVHDCLSEGCRMKEGEVSVRVEQEMREVKKKFWKHKNNCVFFLNRLSFANKKDKYFV